MSGPSSEYDPVQVTPLDEEHVEAMRVAALEAIDGATDLADLKRVRTEHAGDRSPLALANREIGALPPQARPPGALPITLMRIATTTARAWAGCRGSSAG